MHTAAPARRRSPHSPDPLDVTILVVPVLLAALLLCSCRTVEAFAEVPASFWMDAWTYAGIIFDAIVSDVAAAIALFL